MAEFKGTPGPYTVETYCEHGEEPTRGLFVIGPVEADGLPWHLTKVDLGTERDEANAQLFAASWDGHELLVLVHKALLDGFSLRDYDGAAMPDIAAFENALGRYFQKALGSNQEEGR